MPKKKKLQTTLSQWSYDNEKLNKKFMQVKKSVDELNQTLAGKKKK